MFAFICYHFNTVGYSVMPVGPGLMLERRALRKLKSLAKGLIAAVVPADVLDFRPTQQRVKAHRYLIIYRAGLKDGP